LPELPWDKQVLQQVVPLRNCIELVKALRSPKSAKLRDQ